MAGQTTHFIQTLLRPGSLAQGITWRLERKAALGVLLIIVTVSLIGWLYLTQASSLTTTSFEIDQLRTELTTLQQHNVDLELQIAEWEALARIERRALELGFSPPNQVLYLPVPNYPATEQGEE
jgi:cell division protein FtsL